MKRYYFGVGFFWTASLAAETAPSLSPAASAMRNLQGSVITFVAFAVGGALVGALIQRLFSFKSKAMREATFSLAVLAGMSLAMLNHFGI